MVQASSDLRCFDDRLATILRIDRREQSGRSRLWRQLVSFLARSVRGRDSASIAHALAILSALKAQVPIVSRIDSARAIAARCDNPALAALLSHDVPPVVVALFDDIRFASDDWLLILPYISPLARSRLRGRGDLPGSVHRALASLAPSDFALPLPATAAATGDAIAPDAAPVQVAASLAPSLGSPIADLVHRIEAYRNRKPSNDVAAADTLAPIKFTADADGYIRLVDVGPRASLVGVSLAEVAPSGRPGVDAGTASAFARRDGIAGGRLLVATGALWAIDAAPIFAADSGRFAGYRGSLSRNLGNASPDADAAIEPADRGLASAMQQMAHELRSPLNAISGFAQLIAGQYFGPVSTAYRAIADGIMADAAFLAEAFDDIDLASRLDTGRFVAAEGSCTLGELAPGIGHDVVELAVGRADATRLLTLISQATAGGGGAFSKPHGAIGPHSVTLTFDRGDVGEHGMTLAIAERFAKKLGGAVSAGPRKIVVNLPRLRNARMPVDTRT